MKKIMSLLLGIVLATGVLAAPLSAGTIDATGVMTSKPDGANFDYTITLTNTGTDSIGTFWFSWLPGEGFLPHTPTSLISPPGWSEILTNGNGSIQWDANSHAADLAPGKSLVYGFTSPDSPSVLAGKSAQFPGTPILTSTLYQTSPFVGDTTSIIVTQASQVPEPSSLLTFAVFSSVGAAAYLWRRR
jgi:hypothetical protein